MTDNASQGRAVHPTFTSNFNIPTLLSVGTVAFGMVWWGSGVDQRLKQMEDFRNDRVVKTDTSFATINTRLSEMSNLPYRMGQAEARIDETGKRLDRIAESIVASLDGIRKEVGTVSIKVEVLSGKIDALSGQPKRAVLKAPLR